MVKIYPTVSVSRELKKNVIETILVLNSSLNCKPFIMYIG